MIDQDNEARYVTPHELIVKTDLHSKGDAITVKISVDYGDISNPALIYVTLMVKDGYFY